MKKIFLLLLALGHFAVAQEKDKKAKRIATDTTKTNQLDDVFVTANRNATKRRETPTAISKINSKTINETKAVAAYEIINKTPGVLMDSRGNEQHSMAIRQPMTTNAYYLYLEDGLPIRPMGIFNHNALLEINQFNLESIEVVKGPTSSLYGPEAVGGTINLISNRPPVAPEFKFGVQSDQWGYQRIQAAGGATVGKVGFNIAGISSYQKNSWMTFSDYNKDNINARIDYTINSKTRLISNTMYGQYYSDMSGSVNEDAFTNRTYKNNNNFTFRKSDALRTRLTLERDWNTKANSYITAYHRDNKLGQNPSYRLPKSITVGQTTATGEVNSSNFKSYGAVAQHTQKFDFLETRIIGGLLFDFSPTNYWSNQVDLKVTPNATIPTLPEYFEFVQNRPDIRLSNFTADIYNTAEFVQLSIKPLSKLIITGGVRYDNIKLNYDNAIDNSTGSKTFDKTTFKLGANYNPNSFYGLYGNYSQGFAPPGVSSIFTPKSGTGGSTGNPSEFYYDLKPATFENFEIGGWINILKNKLLIDYSLYYMEGKNEQLNILLSNGKTEIQSAGETLHKGVEFGLTYKPSEQINFRLGGTTAQHIYQYFKAQEKIRINNVNTTVEYNLSGFEMPNAPKWSGNSELSYYPKWLPNFRTSVECQYVSSYFQDQVNTVKYDGYAIFNGRIGYQWKSFEFYGNVMNFTDKLYAHNVTRGNLATSQPSYIAAAPRTFIFGIQYNLSLKK